MAGSAKGSGGLAEFGRKALAPLLSRRLLVPLLLLAILLTASNIVILFNAPPPGGRPGAGFAVAAFVRVFGLLLVSVAVLRLVNASARRAWLPDGGFWLFVLAFLFQAALSLAVSLSVRLVRRDLATELILDALVSLLVLPLAAWFVAMAVERPLAWRPGRWLRLWSAWLPHLVLWTALLVVPLGIVHALIGRRLIEGAGDWFWPLALVDGALSLVLGLAGLALASEAYRRVARG